MHIKRLTGFAFVVATLISLRMVGGNVHGSDNSTVRFTENKNQWDRKILYRAQLDGGLLFLQRNAFTYNFYDKETLRKNHIGSAGKDALKTTMKGHAFRMTFLNALPTVKITSKNPTTDYSNYFIGQDRKKWAGNVKNYTEVNYTSLYNGINLQILGKQNSLKYNFFVSPNGNTKDIQMSYEGLDTISIEKGALKLKTSLNEITEHKPYSYQWIGGNKVEVPCEFVLENKTIHFNFPKGYNREVELIIDPELIFACSSGSLADNFGMTATYDAEGNLYSGGTCFDIGFPTTVGAYDVTYNGIVAYGRTDLVITKYDSTGTFLRYSTYLGGADGTEIVTSLIVDAQNNLLLYGATGSKDFPVTPGAYSSTFSGGTQLRFIYNGTYFDNGTDIYVSKLNSTGSSLLASTYIGGTMNDGVNVNNDSVPLGGTGTYEFPADSLQYNYGDQYRGEINVDKSGNVYINSSTRSGNFPVTATAFDKTLGGRQDAVVFKLSPDLKMLVWSSYLGGSDNDAGNAITLDDNDNVYVTGGTRSSNFPSTVGVVQPTYKAGKADGYVTKIKNDGTAILSSTFWGTDQYDQCYFIQLDQNKNVYVVGQTEGKMPVTTKVYNNANSSQFITKMDSSLTKVVFSTVFGNGQSKPNISPSAFLVDYCENIYVSGWGGDIIKQTPISNMPITNDAIQKTTTGFDFYLIVLSRDATDLLYGTYFGGKASQEHVDGGTSRFDKKGVVYQSVCAGCGSNDDFPVYPSNAWPNTGTDVNHSDNCNNGTFKLNFKVPGPLTNFTYERKDSCAPIVVQFKNESPSPKYLWDFGNNDTTSKIKNPIKTYTIPGTYPVKLYVFNALNCYTWDTVQKNINVYESITANFDFTAVPCTREITFTDSSHLAPVSWDWNFGDGTTASIQNPPNHIFGNQNAYNVTLIVKNKFGCRDTTTHEITFADASVSINPDRTICLGSSTNLLASGGYEYSWLPVTGLNNASIPNPVASPAVTTTYTVHIKYINSFGDSCSIDLSTTVNVININSILLDATVDKDTLLKGESTVLHAVTNPGLSVQWTPTTGVADPTALNTAVTPTQTTTYTVTITGSSGCSKSDTVTIYIISNECDDESVFVPNTFTPNGDGQNDILFARSNNLTSAYFAVYNRWGELVFETTDFHKGWDGIYKGMKADPAVFAWYVKGKCLNGKELFKKGNVTLIR